MREGDLKAVTVFCGTQDGPTPIFRQSATDLGAELGRRSIRLVFGGGKEGMMGALADAVLAEQGTVTGVVPRFIAETEVLHPNVTEMLVSDYLYDRKRLMLQLGDAFCILPGGLGTLDELADLLGQAHLGIIAKPVVLLNVEGFWDPLLTLLAAMYEKNFSRERPGSFFRIVRSAQEVIPAILSH
jgi:uncharacterized protein (TIGR00730 family)